LAPPTLQVATPLAPHLPNPGAATGQQMYSEYNGFEVGQKSRKFVWAF